MFSGENLKTERRYNHEKRSIKTFIWPSGKCKKST